MFEKIMLGIALIVVAVIGFYAGGHIFQQEKSNNTADQIYREACLNMDGVLIDNSCYDPVKLKEAKLYIPFG